MLDESGERLGRRQGVTADTVRPLLSHDFFARRGSSCRWEDDRRRFMRRYYRIETVARLEGTLPAFVREPETTVVYLADLSRGGLSFICDRELYPSERVDVEIPKLGFRGGLVRRCQRIAAGCFVIGCEFSAASPARSE
jgi:hypothetical protein